MHPCTYVPDIVSRIRKFEIRTVPTTTAPPSSLSRASNASRWPAASSEGSFPESMVAEEIGRPIDHVVPYDKAVPISAHRGAPVVLVFHRHLH